VALISSSQLAEQWGLFAYRSSFMESS